MDDFHAQYRYVVRWRLWEPLPRTNRLVGHISRGYSVTFCGQDSLRLVVMHVTVARAIGADDCKSCFRASAAS